MSVLSLIPEDKKKDSRKESVASVYSSNSRLNLLQKRKRVNPLEEMSSGPKGFVSQRVLSAKAHRVKQLQNQLADAHYHLQELSNENKILRALQKKQEIALQRYENSNAELPTVLHSHNEEVRIQQARYKQLKKQLQEVQQKLKERDMQLQQLRDEHNHLLELCRDRNLKEREVLQNQVTELTAKCQQQSDTISTLQRRIALEAKNFRHQLQNEINKHKDTRHDLDLAINNADKLSTIIEMKERMLSTAASRSVKSPNKAQSALSLAAKPISKHKVDHRGDDKSDRAENLDCLSKLCENSRSMASAMSHDEESSSSAEPRSRYIRSRASVVSTNSTRSTPNPRKNSKESDEYEIAKTVQEGMAELTLYDDDRNSSPDEMQKRIEHMKQDLMHKIKNEEPPKKPNLMKRQSTEESIEEDINEVDVPPERPKSRGRRGSSVSFYNDTTIEETTTTITINDYKNEDDMTIAKPKSRASSGTQRNPSGKSLDKYCKEIMSDIEKSSKVIDKHMKQFNHCKFEGDKLVEQLAVVDKINDFVNSPDIPDSKLQELNNNFRMLTDSVLSEVPVARKRSISGRRNSKIELNNKLDDPSMSNQDLLNDLLGRAKDY